MKSLFTLILLMGFCFCSFAQEMRLDKKKRPEAQSVVGHGQYVFLESDTVESAYIKAENLAKADASKQVGQYYEVLNIVDSSTGKNKEIVASIAASVSKYEITDKKVTPFDDQLIAEVWVKGSASRVQLDTAIKRYLSSAKYKEEILSLKKTTALLELSLKEKDVLYDLLKQDSLTQTGKVNLKRKLYFNNKEIADLAMLYGDSIGKAHGLSKFIDGEELATDARALSLAIEEADVVYVSRLHSLLDEFHYNLDVSKTVDPINNVIDVLLYPEWSSSYWHLAKTLLPEMEVDQNWYQPLDLSGTRIIPFQLDMSPMAVVARRYSVFYVVSVNGVKREFPILTPKESRYNSGYSRNQRVRSVDTGLYSNRCLKGFEIGGEKERDDLLCFNYKFNFGTVYYKNVMSLSSSRYDRYVDALTYVVPIGDDILVDTYFDIRDVTSKESIYKKRF
jgi:hypothetical protein